MQKTVKWDKTAANDLKAAIRFISNDSEQNAEKVKEDILSATKKLSHNPEKYPVDKYKKSNAGGVFRAFELYRYRISYVVTESEVIIVRFRHTSMAPLDY